MQLTLEADEAAVLKDALTQYLADLRGEIGMTDDYGTRQELKQREATLQKIVNQLGQQA
ncbi:MAG: hypothetical protein ACRDJE_28105 [Dehalococcoidia bacterium]